MAQTACAAALFAKLDPALAFGEIGQHRDVNPLALIGHIGIVEHGQQDDDADAQEGQGYAYNPGYQGHDGVVADKSSLPFLRHQEQDDGDDRPEWGDRDPGPPKDDRHHLYQTVQTVFLRN